MHAAEETVTDLGPQVLDWLAKTMQIDAEWIDRDARSFTWWPHRFRQQVVADVPRESAGEQITRVTVTTPVLRDVRLPDGGLELINAANMAATLSCMVFDEERGALRVGTAASFHPGNRPWLSKVIASATAIQIAVLHAGEPDLLASALGGALDVAPHPMSGERVEPDDMLSVVPLYQLAARGPSTMSDGDFRDAAMRLQAPGLSARAVGTRLELAIETPRLDVPMQLVVENSEHPGFGHGLFVLLAAPSRLGDREFLVHTANRLNTLELTERLDGHAFGAWAENRDRLHHVAFYPNLVLADDDMQSRRARLLNTAFDEMTRARWLNSTWGPAFGRRS